MARLDFGAVYIKIMVKKNISGLIYSTLEKDLLRGTVCQRGSFTSWFVHKGKHIFLRLWAAQHTTSLSSQSLLSQRVLLLSCLLSHTCVSVYESARSLSTSITQKSMQLFIDSPLEGANCHQVLRGNFKKGNCGQERRQQV